MRTVSEQFKARLDETIRQPMKLYFEVGSKRLFEFDTMISTDYWGFDTTVAPVVLPRVCSNEHYYSVLGDDSPVGDPNRICVNSDVEIASPTTIPIGITPFTEADTYRIIGTTDIEEIYYNLSGFDSQVIFSFKGGTIPTTIKVCRFDFDLDDWVVESEIDNSEENEEVVFTPSDYEQSSDPRILYVKNATKSGRFQLNWIKKIPENDTIVFENNMISKVSISEEVDLTSQTLPTYDITVECLDTDELYTPENECWKNQFKEGSACYFQAGYEIDGFCEYLPLFFGKLTQSPNYDNGKLSFSITVSSFKERAFNEQEELHEDSLPDSSLGAGDSVKSWNFSDFTALEELFDEYNIFTNSEDDDNSVCNFFGIIGADEGRQKIANALGGYILYDVGKTVLLNSNEIQYKDPADTIGRYDQVKCTLESRKKVGKIVINRKDNVVSSSATQVTIPTREYCRGYGQTRITFKVPFFAIGKFTIADYRKSVSSAAMSADLTDVGLQTINEDGTVNATITFSHDRTTYIQPIVNFYQAETKDYEGTTFIGEGEETYTNDNELITNTYTASKAERIAHLINDISNQYEVDVVQDFRYQPGDVIRLETEKGVFKTCVITGAKFTLPGSNGHISCRKIFSFFDSRYAVEPEWRELNFNGNEYTFALVEGVEATTTPCVIAYQRTYLDDGNYHMVVINLGGYCYAGYDDWERSTTTDDNAHEWKYEYTSAITEEPPEATFPILHLPDYDYRTASTSDYVLYGVVKALKELYKEQGMVAPIDYPVDGTNNE